MLPTPKDPDESFEVTESLRVPIAPGPGRSETSGAAGPFVRADINITLSNVAIKTKVPVPAGPTSLRQLLPIFRAFTEAIVHAATERSVTAGRPVSCKAHCGACCRQLVPISEPEAHMLAGLVAALPEPRGTEIQRRFAAAREELAAANLLEQLSDLPGQGEQSLNEAAARYFQEQIPCPFLEEESCSIYGERPLICREYLVTSDPCHCATLDSEVVCVSLPGSMSSALARTSEKPPADTAQPRPYRRIALSLALDWAAAHPETKPVTTGPELLNQVLAQLSSTVAKSGIS